MMTISRLPEAVRSQPLAAFLKAAGKAMVILFIPFALMTGLNEYFSALDHNRRLAAEQQEMMKILSEISAQAEPRQRFDAEFKNLSALPFPSENFDRRLKQMLANDPGALDVYLYDEAGSCMTVPFLPVPPRMVAQKFLECVKDPSLAARYERFVFQFSGYRSAHALLNRAPETVVKLGGSHDRRWGGWFQLRRPDGTAAGHLLVFIRHSALSTESLLDKAVIAARQKQGRRFSFAWQDPADPLTLCPSGHGFSAEIISRINDISFGEAGFTINNLPGALIYSDDGAAIIAQANYVVDEGLLHTAVRFSLVICLGLTFLLLTPVFMGITVFVPGLKARLVGIFLFGAGVALVLLIFTGVADRNEREKVLADESQNRNIEALTLIDEGMSYDYRVLENIFKSVIRKADEVKKDDFSSTLRRLGGLFSFSDAISQILFVTGTDSISFTREIPGGKKAGQKDSMVIYGEMLLSIFNGKYDEDTSRKGSTDLKSVVNNFGGWLARAVILNSGKIGSLNLLSNVMPTYIDFFVDRSYQARAMLFVFMSQSGLQRNYLLKISRLRDRLRSPHDPRFAAVPVAISPFWPAFPRRTTADNQILGRMADQVIRNGVPVHDIATIGSRKYLLSAVRGSNLDGYVLIMAQPYVVIAEKLAVLRRNLQLLSILVVLTAFIAARITSSLLLQPLGNLKGGLEAFSAGNFRSRLPDATVSEFASMMGSFNQTMNYFQELQVARSVQETLWPDESPGGPDWDLCGRCVTATELGGDHYDWMKLRDGRILLVVGDVTGHGIAPAMIQASTKVWLAMNAEKCADAVSLLTEISRLHFSYGARRLYMTCWLGYYTPETGLLEYASAGHPYPVMVDMAGKAEMLKLPGMPLGVKAKPQINGDSRVLAPGARLILYTDGLVETTNKAGQMLGYDGFVDICAGAAGLSALKTVEQIFGAAAAWGPQNDDQTVIVLMRHGQGGAHETI